MRIESGATTDVGRVREGNEDAFLASDPLFAVADGMGGHRGGEVASRLALDTLDALFKRGRGTLADHIREANRAVFERSVLDRKVAGMGTTLTAAAMEQSRVRLVHVGDSRAYLLRDGALRLLTEDHTLVREMVERGEITPREAEVHPHRSVLTRAVGTEPDVAVDEQVVEIREGDRLLLCTDGLTGMLSEQTIGDILSEEADPQVVADRLVAEANREGGVDNITALVLDVRGAGGAGPRPDTQALEAEPAADARPAEPRRRWTRPLAWITGVAVALVLALTGVRLYLDAQWYVGLSGGRVAVFRGIPVEVAGLRLHSVVEVTEVRAGDARELAHFGELEEGIPAESREGAEQIVDQIRSDLEAVKEIGNLQNGGGK
jgi:protein phosphatase